MIIRYGSRQPRDKNRPLWPRTDEIHFTANDIDQLRQLVQMKQSQDLAEWCNSRVLWYTPDGTGDGFCIFVHRTNLEHRELDAISPCSDLPIQSRSWRRQTNDCHEEQDEGTG